MAWQDREQGLVSHSEEMDMEMESESELWRE